VIQGGKGIQKAERGSRELQLVLDPGRNIKKHRDTPCQGEIKRPPFGLIGRQHHVMLQREKECRLALPSFK
jgi:hypothetical protein